MVQKATEDLHSRCPLASKFKSGYVAIVGLPNAGKSTLLNPFIGSKIAIVSDKPQTTRNNIVGVYTSKDAQVIFMDTPGLHQHPKKMNRFLVEEALRSMGDADVVVYLFDANYVSKKNLEEDKFFLEQIVGKIPEEKLLPVVSKVDLVKEHKLVKLTEELRTLDFKNDVLHISVHQNIGVVNLMDKIIKKLPEGPKYYSDDTITDRDIRFLCSEIIREKVFIKTSREIPYSVAVEIEQYEEKETIHNISAVIYVERDSQKGIVIGKQGSMLKSIGSEARQDIEKLIGMQVFLKIFVKVRKDWTKDDRVLKELGYK